MAATLLLAGTMASPAGADPTPFASGSATCSGGVVTVNFPVVAGYHGNVVYRLTSQDATGSNSSGSNSFTPAFGPGDQIWGGAFAVNAGTAPTMYVDSCSGSLSVDLFDRSPAPVTLTGTSTGSQTLSDLPFTAAHSGQYVVDASVTQGAVSLVYSFPNCDAPVSLCPAVTVMRSGEYPLGSLSAGDYDLPIAGIDGPTAGWSMTVRELPVQISNLAFPAQFIQPGSPLIASFSVSGDTTLSAYARNATRQPVDELGSWAAKEGSSSITWDGRDSSGNIVPDGTYYLHLDSTDPNGNTTSAETPVTVDGTRPAITMTSAQTVRPWQAVSFSVIDSGSGLASFQVIIDGQNAGEYDSFTGLPANGQISFSNYYGAWNLGTHNWEIIATDAVGNQADVRGSFTAANPPPPTPPPPPISAGVYAAGMFNPFAHRPGTLRLWASDALINLRWVNWGRPTTSSSGRETSHVRGRYTSRPAQVQLSQIQVCKRRRVYTHVRYRIVGQRWKTGHYNRNTCRLSG